MLTQFIIIFFITGGSYFLDTDFMFQNNDDESVSIVFDTIELLS